MSWATASAAVAEAVVPSASVRALVSSAVWRVAVRHAVLVAPLVAQSVASICWSELTRVWADACAAWALERAVCAA